MRASSRVDTLLPFLKWAGGKRWLVSGELLPIPDDYERYVEPFVGSGAVFFHLRPKKALLSDLNEELICLYQVIRDKPSNLWSLMEAHHEQHCKGHYYKVRTTRPTDDLQRASRFLYLNRTCWNGLYRVNLEGVFNVPVGTKDSVVFDTDDFGAVSRMLAGTEIRCADFKEVIDECGQGDFVFIDPPYTVQHNHNNFLKYNERIFSWDDQIRLRDAVMSAVGRGATIAITNADHQTIRDLYEGVGSYRQLHRHSVLAGKAAKRGATTEALFLANF